MVNLVKVNDLDEKTYAELAAAYGISLEPEVEPRFSKKQYITFTKFEPEDTTIQIRELKSSWLNDDSAGQFLWSLLGEEDIEEVEGMPRVNQLGGFILHSQIQPQRNPYLQDEKKYDYENSCSVIGYWSPKEEAYVKGLPETTPLKNMYAWNDDAKIYDPREADSLVKSMQLLGSRGMPCEACIAAGLSQIENNGKIQRCEPKGKIYFYLTHVSSIKKSKEDKTQLVKNTKSIQELMGVPGIILAINLPTKTGLVGERDKTNPENSIAGFSTYLNFLKKEARENKNPALANPFFNFTTITIRQPLEGSKNPKNSLHFQKEEGFDMELFVKGREEWTSVYTPPQIEKLNINDFQGVKPLPGEVIPEDLEGVDTIPVNATEVSPMKSAEVIEDLEDTPF